MELIIKNNGGLPLGRVVVSDKGLAWEDQSDPELKRFVADSIDKGIPMYREIFSDKSKTFIFQERKSDLTSPVSPIVLRDFLINKGYIVIENRLEIDEEILKLLERLPVDDPAKQELLDKLPNLSYLDKTFILEKIKTPIT